MDQLVKRLKYLATLSPSDIEIMRAIVEYRIDTLMQEEFDRIKEISKYPRLAERG